MISPRSIVTIAASYSFMDSLKGAKPLGVPIEPLGHGISSAVIYHKLAS
jgi:hypothetical protein